MTDPTQPVPGPERSSWRRTFGLLRAAIALKLAKHVWPPSLAGWLSCVVAWGPIRGHRQYTSQEWRARP